MRGKGEARQIGYPTANIAYESSVSPESGIWICFVEYDGEWFKGLAVIDMWKLPNGLPSVEVHILDFDRDVYGSSMNVALLTKLRDLEQFTTIENLMARIKEDIVCARQEFAELEKKNQI